MKSFQDLNVWKESHFLTLEIYKITKNFPKEENYGIISQLRRASSSVPANIAEGMGKNTTKELLNFIYNARGSLSETIYHLILSNDLGYIKEAEFDTLHSRYNGLAKGVNVFISKLKT
ncbi:MAG: four helix bundle protein [Candidatus Nealsonbacteria bacterium]|nr:four helix bundle protein [Candidatus Nealsonbacteria bacterium]